MINTNEESDNFENVLKRLKEDSLNRFAKVRLLQFISNTQEFINTDVEKIFVDLNCEQFRFNIINSSERHERDAVYSCLERLKYHDEKGNKNIVILGLPGAGKSTLLKRLFEQYWDNQYVIPIYVELKQEERRGGFLRLWNYKCAVSRAHLNDYLEEYFNSLSVLDAKSLLAYLNNKRYHFVFFCDGLDEVSKEQYEAFTETVNTLGEWATLRFIISSRQVGFSKRDYSSELFSFYSLMDFDTIKQREFVEKYFEIVAQEWSDEDELKKQKTQLIEALEKPFIQRMAKSPILLSLLCVTPNLQDIKNKSQLFDNAIRVLLNNRNINESEEQRIFVDFLKYIAVVFFKLDKAESFDADELGFYADKFFCEEGICNINLKNKYLDCGLFDQVDTGNRKMYKFAHRTIWEYLVAVGMVDRDKNEIYNRANMIIWEEPIKMWVTLIASKSEVEMAEVFKDLWQRNKALTLVCMNELDPFPNKEFNTLYNGLTKRDKLRLIATLRDSYVNPSSDYRKQAINTIRETLTLIHRVERDCEVIYSYLEFLEEFRQESTFEHLLYDFLDYGNLPDRQQKMERCGLLFIDVAAGTFNMGRNAIQLAINEDKNQYINVDAEEMPAHKVRLSKSFRISKTLVTNQMFYDSGFPYISKTVSGEPVFKGNPYSEYADQPVNYVNWYEAMVFAKWIGCTLPTEAEWEYACRGMEHEDYMSDNLQEMILLLDKKACYASRNVGHPNKTRSVFINDQGIENSLGLVDMLGNLREWCLDWYSDDFYKKCSSDYYASFEKDIVGKESITYYFDTNGEAVLIDDEHIENVDTFTFDKDGYCIDPIKRVPGKFEAKCLRGGCFDWNESNLRPTYRNHNPANNVYKVNGFRLVFKEDK